MRQHSWAWPTAPSKASPQGDVMLPNPGDYHYRHGGEQHYNSPAAMAELQLAARTNSRKAYETYAQTIYEQSRSTTLRGILAFRTDLPPVPLDAVEPASEIVKRFCTGAMSLGSISTETHEALAKAMNTLGGKSNTGEERRGPAPLRRQPPLRDQADCERPLRRDVGVPDERRRAPDQDGAGGEAGRGRRARPLGDPAHRQHARHDAGRRADLPPPPPTSTRSRTSRSSSTTSSRPTARRASR